MMPAGLLLKLLSPENKKSPEAPRCRPGLVYTGMLSAAVGEQ